MIDRQAALNRGGLPFLKGKTMNPKLTIDEALLISVEGYCRDGLTDEQLASKLGITARSLYNYIAKYPELKEAMNRGKAPVDFQAENALLKKCLGCRVEKVCTTIHADGSVTEKRTVTELPPDTEALKLWLRNRKADKWRESDNSGDSPEAIKALLGDYIPLLMNTGGRPDEQES